MGASTGVYAVAVSAFALAVLFVLALARCSARADRCSERLLAEGLREQERALAELARMPIEVRRLYAREVTAQLSHRRTWRQPSSA